MSNTTKKKVKPVGKRKSAGRHTLPPGERKVPVTIYVSKKVIDELGIDVLKARCYSALERVQLNPHGEA